MKEAKINWIIQQHQQTSHFYDTYLPYEFHLRMVVQVGREFDIFNDNSPNDYLELALWGHDLIEDTRTSYNEVKLKLGERTADVIYAVTNEKGKNRAERANNKYYQGILDCQGALSVKLCDRIANIRYSLMTKSRMLEMYRKENDEFCKKLWLEGARDKDAKMFNHLSNLLAVHHDLL